MISKTYTLYIDYLSIYADLSPALHQHTYAHTQRMDGTTHDRTGSCRRLLDYSKGDFILILSFSSSQKKVLQRCSLSPYQLHNNALLIHVAKFRHFLCNIFCLLVDILRYVFFKKKNKRSENHMQVSDTNPVSQEVGFSTGWQG